MFLVWWFRTRIYRLHVVTKDASAGYIPYLNELQQRSRFAEFPKASCNCILFVVVCGENNRKGRVVAGVHSIHNTPNTVVHIGVAHSVGNLEVKWISSSKEPDRSAQPDTGVDDTIGSTIGRAPLSATSLSHSLVTMNERFKDDVELEETLPLHAVCSPCVIGTKFIHQLFHMLASPFGWRPL